MRVDKPVGRSFTFRRPPKYPSHRDFNFLSSPAYRAIIATGDEYMPSLDEHVGVMALFAASLDILIRLMKALVWPVATYGCKSWTLRKNEETRLDAFEMK